MRRLRRWLGLALTVVALGLAGTSGLQIARDPLLRPMVERGQAELAAVLARETARLATPARLEAMIAGRLDEVPRNWTVIDALVGLAADHGQALPPALTERIAAARDEDGSVLTMAADCAACAFDPAACTLTYLMACGMPVMMTPVGDLAGLARGAGVDYAAGDEIDQLDLALSVVGLGATVAVVASGGSSAVVKAGAGFIRAARRMNLLSPRLVGLLTDAARRGVDWAALPAVRSSDDLTRLVRMDALAPVLDTARDLERVRAATGTEQALHLLPMVDDAADARRLARAAEASGPRLTAQAEVLGKARLMRVGLRLGDTALGLVAGLIGSLLALAHWLAAVLQSVLMSGFGRLLRRA